MTLRRQLKVLRHRAGRWAGGRRWLASISLVAAMGVTAALLVLVVSENTVNATGAPAKAAAPSTVKKGTAPKSGVKTTTPTTKPAVLVIPSLQPKTAARIRLSRLTEVDNRCAEECAGSCSSPVMYGS